MSLTLRNVKGSPLTYTEMDNNLTYLEGVAGATGGTGIFDDLVVSGTSSLGDVVIANNKKINAASGDGQLDLRYGGDSKVMLSTDAGVYSKEYLNIESGYVELSAVDTGGSRIAMYADEYDAGLLIGNYNGAATLDFLAYGKNGFLIENRTQVPSERIIIKHNDNITIDCLRVVLPTIPTYADNAAAVAGDLPLNGVYKTSTGELRIVV